MQYKPTRIPTTRSAGWPESKVPAPAAIAHTAKTVTPTLLTCILSYMAYFLLARVGYRSSKASATS